jgi:hypothetical protein
LADIGLSFFAKGGKEGEVEKYRQIKPEDLEDFLKTRTNIKG